MVFNVLGFLLVALALTALALQRFYSSVPAKELRRLAARGDGLATHLYKAVAYGASLRLLLWMVVSAGLSGGLLLLASGLPGWAAFIVAAAVLGIGFVLLQSARLTVRTAGFAAAVAPAIGAFLGRVEPVLGRVTGVIHRRRSFTAHSGLYEKEDLIDLLDQQRGQHDNRIGHDELELARRALHFNETQAADVMLVRTAMKSLHAGDAIGPILLEELHRSGQSAFAVYDDDGQQIVGMLAMQDALRAKEGGKVSALMSRELVYVHEDFSLRQALDACLKSSRQLALVVNAFEEVVGIVTLDMLLGELFEGPGAVHVADIPYENRAAVAAYKPAAAADAPKAEPEPTEVPADTTPSADSPEVVQ